MASLPQINSMNQNQGKAIYAGGIQSNPSNISGSAVGGVKVMAMKTTNAKKVIK